MNIGVNISIINTIAILTILSSASWCFGSDFSGNDFNKDPIGILISDFGRFGNGYQLADKVDNFIKENHKSYKYDLLKYKSDYICLRNDKSVARCTITFYDKRPAIAMPEFVQVIKWNITVFYKKTGSNYSIMKSKVEDKATFELENKVN